MNSTSTLLSIGQFDLKLHHLLIIGILALSFSVSFLLRSSPAEFGWELHEFDPFFNYRATEYIVNNGIDSYFAWNDELSWYPHGRNISDTSQVMLHITAAITYWISGSNNLYDFTILFPVIFGSLTTIIIFALVRVIGGTTAGLLASLFFSVSIPIIVRGQLGWFKSEPLGLFFSILALYLFLSGINSNNKKITITKLIGAGILFVFGLSAWGGDQFFIIPLGVLFITLPFLRKDHKFLIWTIPLFTISTLLTSLLFERLSTTFVFGLGGLSLAVPTIFLVICILIQNKSNEKSKTRNGLLFLLAIIIIASSLLILNDDSAFISLPSYRYLNAINPFFTTTVPLIDSVSEHATTTMSQSFLFHSVLMIFAGIGIWLILKSNGKQDFIKNDMISFCLIFSLFGVYISSAFVRLEVFGSLSVILLSSIAISILIKKFFSYKHEIKTVKNNILKLSFLSGIIILLIIPLALPEISVSGIVDTPPTILNGGTKYQIGTSDWLDAMDWIKNNTSENAVVGAWWDYGYWIQTKGERASLADNSTLIDHVIKKIAKAFISSPDEGWELLREMESDYFLVFVAGERLLVDHNGQPLYLLNGGGDEMKKQWFMRIAEEPLQKYLHLDQTSGTNFFWNETLLGKMIPFSPVVYIHPQTNEQSISYQPGFVPVYTKNIKFSENQNGPLRLVYASPSFDVEKGGHVIGIFIYEINKEYVRIN
ncbi:STT3 domain-containing protein [Nitrosopumilus sp.]|uniref:STT3 domain-containing protein n=1 Tax=Nitrosopumilus sp. TaxID=2024843 RepID=UPI003D131555